VARSATSAVMRPSTKPATSRGLKLGTCVPNTPQFFPTKTTHASSMIASTAWSMASSFNITITAFNPNSSSTGNQHGNMLPNTTRAFPPSDSLSRTHPDVKPRKVCRAEPSVVKQAILVGGSSSDCCLDGAARSDHLLALFAFSQFTISVRLS
jgi:hypothetical protein